MNVTTQPRPKFKFCYLKDFKTTKKQSNSILIELSPFYENQKLKVTGHLLVFKYNHLFLKNKQLKPTDCIRACKEHLQKRKLFGKIESIKPDFVFNVILK